MGTKNCPETPRQKMINMMYLVLTAMLALNVAAETLKAFKIIDGSLMKTYSNFREKNQAIIEDFNLAYEINQDKVDRWRDLAVQVHRQTDSLIHYIIETKELLVYGADGHKKLSDEEISDESSLILDRN
nr:hypothetical protein [Prolixibacteraceae bacterium]